MKIGHWWLPLVLAAIAGCSEQGAASSDAGAGAAQQSAGSGSSTGTSSVANTAATSMMSNATAFSGSPQPLPQGTVRMQRVDIMDPAGFGQPMVAATVLIPFGWTSKGGIVWGPFGTCGPDYANNWTATSPDGASSITVLPVPNWEGVQSNYPVNPVQPPCVQASFTSAREYLQAATMRMYPQARIRDFRSLDDEVKQLRESIAQMPSFNDQNMQSRIVVDAGEVLVELQENGQNRRAAISATVMITQSRYADMLNPGQIGMQSVHGVPSYITIVQAPAGQLDLKLRKRIQSSIRFSPQWSAQLAQYNARKNKSFSDSMTAQHNIRMQSIRDQGNIINGIYNDRQLASDHNQREFIESIRGVETYNDPASGGAVQLDNNYQHAWRNNSDGSYILTNDASFDPQRYNLDASELQVMQ